MLDKLLELLLVGTIGCGMLAAAFVVGDVIGALMHRAMDWFFFRMDRAQYRLAWQEVARRHKRKVRV